MTSSGHEKNNKKLHTHTRAVVPKLVRAVTQSKGAIVSYYLQHFAYISVKALSVTLLAQNQSTSSGHFTWNA